METIQVDLQDRSYPIHIGSGCACSLGARFREILSPRRVLVVTNPEIGRLHAGMVMDSLRAAGFEAGLLEVPEGEKAKTVATVEAIWDRLARDGFARQDALVALGGGVVGDMTGFAAATYMRGIDFVQVPTSLLAMVDSSVGGKTGVNHPRAKNIIGAFWQPRMVLIDVDMLQTLPVEEFRSGFAEVIKHGVIRDAAYFEYLETRLDAIFGLDPAVLSHIVAGSCRIKAAVVAADEREGGIRAILNFGHTLGHAAEALFQYEGTRHGVAVGIGMAGETEIAIRMGLCPAEVGERLVRLLERSGLPTRFPDFPTDDVFSRLQMDKKVQNGRVRFVLPTDIGSAVIRNDVPQDILTQVVRSTGG